MGVDPSQMQEEFDDSEVDDYDFAVGDDAGHGEEEDEVDEADGEQGVSSHYFEAAEDPEVSRFNQQVSQTQTFTAPRANTKAVRTQSWKRSSSQRNVKGGARRKATTTSKSRTSDGGVAKKGRTSTGSKASAAASSRKPSGGTRHHGGGGGLFGMMPT